jgi:hypothetical protein
MMIAGLFMLLASPGHAISDADKCEAAKNKIAGKYAFCRQKAEAKAIRSGSQPDYAACDAKYGLKWGIAESNAGGQCPTNGDAGAIQACITAHTDDIAAALNGAPCGLTNGVKETGQGQCDQGAGTLGSCPGSPAGQDGAVNSGPFRTYTDNGDGTITDHATGLMWEKLSSDGSIHDYGDCAHIWYTAGTKIATLNGTSFAGHNDWRLPNINELETLVNYGTTDPAIDTAFNSGCVANCTVTTCSCTLPGRYWSSTTAQISQGMAWMVDLIDGSNGWYSKNNGYCVRAVRGGL